MEINQFWENRKSSKLKSQIELWLQYMNSCYCQWIIDYFVVSFNAYEHSVQQCICKHWCNYAVCSSHNLSGRCMAYRHQQITYCRHCLSTTSHSITFNTFFPLFLGYHLRIHKSIWIDFESFAFCLIVAFDWHGNDVWLCSLAFIHSPVYMWYE